MQFEKIINSFFQDYSYYKIDPITFGNINKTYLLSITYQNLTRKYILQMINDKVFINPKEVMKNIVTILNYYANSNLFIIKTLNGQDYHIDNDGKFWRIYNYISDCISISQTNDLTLIEETGRAFGNFLFRINTLNSESLSNTIENFHNTKLRFETLQKSAKENISLFGEIKREYDLLLNLKNESCKLQTIQEGGGIPLRIVHNDTKCNNVLIDKKTKKYISVIDFDTVMPGIIAHDFGDGARSICVNLSEEDIRVDEVRFDLEKFYFYSRGFIGEVKDILTEAEKSTLYLGIITIATELSVRFLTDYLQNNHYFKIDYPNQNKNRAINQLVLAYDLLDKTKQIKEIIYSLL